MPEIQIRTFGALGILGIFGVWTYEPALFGLFALFALFASERTVVIPTPGGSDEGTTT